MQTELPDLQDLRMSLPAPDVQRRGRRRWTLADPIRASIVRMLRDGPVCVCEMAAALGVRENNVSNHLARLREAGLVRASRVRRGTPADLLRTRRRGLRRGLAMLERVLAVTALAVRRSAHILAGRRPSPVDGWLIAWFVDRSVRRLVRLRGARPGTRHSPRRGGRLLRLDVPKVLLLLLGIVTVVTLSAAYFPPERVRAALAGRGDGGRRPRRGRLRSRHPVLLLLGGAAVHRFRGGRHPAGRDLRLPHQLTDGQRGGAGPAVGPVRAGDRAHSTWRPGLTVAIVGGLFIGRLHLERYVEDYVWAVQGAGGAPRDPAQLLRGPGPRCLGETATSSEDLAVHPRRHRHRGIHPRLRADRPGGRDRRPRNPLAVPWSSCSRSRSTPTRRARSRSSRRCSARGCRSAPPSPS